MGFQVAAALDDLWSGEMMSVPVGARRVLLINKDGIIHAYEDKCPHMGVRLSEGRLEPSLLTCAAHHWQYDPSTGCGLNPSTARLTAFPVKMERDMILVDVDPPEGTMRAGREAAGRTGGRTHPSNGIDLVGPVLAAGRIADAVIAAIRDLNVDVEVLDRGAYLRVLVPRRCVLTREAVEKHLGRQFLMPNDLESVMSSLRGALEISGEGAVWSFSSERHGAESEPSPAR